MVMLADPKLGDSAEGVADPVHSGINPAYALTPQSKT
jgi:hypothetical protein